MNNNLVVIISGNRRSGKSSLAKFILSEYLNLKIGQKRFCIKKIGKEISFIDTFNGEKPIIIDAPTIKSEQIASTYSAKIYDFSQSVNNICINLLGFDPSQLYGSESDRNTDVGIEWDNLPLEIKEKYKNKRGKIPKGKMSAIEVHSVIKDDFLRRIDKHCIARGIYNIVFSDNHKLSIVIDPVIPSDITMGTEKGCKAIRLLKKDNLSDQDDNSLPLGEYSLVVDNQNMTLDSMFLKVKPTLLKWFSDKGLI